MESALTNLVIHWFKNSAASLAIVVLIVCGWIFSVCLHEFGHAVVAYWGGDTTVKQKGYLTLNPLKYTDLIYSLVYPLLLLVMGGIALPGATVYVNPHLLRHPVWRSAMSAAGPGATALMAGLLAIPFHLGLGSEPHWIGYVLACLASLQVAACCLSLLPVPSLDGFGVIKPWLPPTWQHRLGPSERYGFLVLVAILWTVPPARTLLKSTVMGLSQGLGIPIDLAIAGYDLLRQSSPILCVLIMVIFLMFSKAFRPSPASLKPRDLDSDNLKASLAAYDRAIQSGRHTVEVWYGRGCILGQMERYQEAVSCYDRALSYQPDHPELWRNRARALYQLARYEEAVDSYERVMSLGSVSSEDWYCHGTLMAQLDCYEKAIASYNQALDAQPDNPSIWYDRGMALYWLERHQEAIASYDRAIELDPSLEQAWFRRGLALNRLEQFQQALSGFEQALKINPENAAIWAAKGFSLLQMDQCEAAIAAHQKSLQLNPNDAHAWYNRACCHARLGQQSLALESLHQAVRLNPEPTRELAQTDPDFAQLRLVPEFQQLTYLPG